MKTIKKLILLAAVAAGVSLTASAHTDDYIDCDDESVERMDAGGRIVYVFTNTAAAATVTLKQQLTLEQALVVGGGGGGGCVCGGGGGGGGVLVTENPFLLAADGTLTVTVGTGGLGGGHSPNGNSNNQWYRGLNGGASSLVFGGTTLSALGGGGGGGWSQAQGTGGTAVANPGGSTYSQSAPAAGASGTCGGAAALNSPGGGAGAGGDGQMGRGYHGGAGGIGISCSITGTPTYYGGGGGGGTGSGLVCTYPGAGGLGGGGTASAAGSSAALATRSGVNGLGGGGAGGTFNTTAGNPGGDGGSGTVILAFAAGDTRDRFFTVEPIEDQTDFGCEPEPVVKNLKTGAMLTKGDDYTVTYRDTDGAGTATAVVTGKGVYAGLVREVPFTITIEGLDDGILRVADPTVRKRKAEGGFLVYTFTNIEAAKRVEVMAGIYIKHAYLVGGGGSGGGSMGGGGGGGGVAKYEDLMASYVAGDVLSMTIGAGGVFAKPGYYEGVKGGDTKMTIGGVELTATGGGCGGGFSYNKTGGAGGCGGGGANNSAGGAGVSGQGLNGGRATGSSGYSSGGGGGADEEGKTAADGATGNGGAGWFCEWDGRTYGGGGGAGGAYNNFAKASGGYGGAGGGGGGGCTTPGVKGVDGLGGGGGGGGWPNGNEKSCPGGNGGSGAVILVIGRCNMITRGDIPVQIWTAGGCRPKPVVTDADGNPLEEGDEKDYVLEYENNLQPGVATVRVIGKGDHASDPSIEMNFSIIMRFRVKPGVETEGDGQSWESPVSLSNALTLAENGGAEIWLQQGVYTQSATMVSHAYATGLLSIRGGFAGAEADLAQRPSGTESVLHGDGAYDHLSFSNTPECPVLLERLALVWALNRAVAKSGAGDLTLADCRLSCNGRATSTSGRALYASGSSSATVTITNCVIDGNMYMGGGQGISCCAVRFTSCAQVVIDDTLFATNGWRHSSPAGGFAGGDNTGDASAIRADSAPVSARGCRFVGNAVSIRYGADGGCVRLTGTSGGSEFVNCAWVGNCDWLSYQSSGSAGSGALVVNLSSTDATVDLRNCTVAYNFTACNGSSGGINVVKGRVRVSDSIIYGNIRGGNNPTAGADLAVAADGWAELAHTAITADDTAHISNVTTGHYLPDPKTVYVMNPLFVSPSADFERLVSTCVDAVGTQYKYLIGNLPVLCGLDVHLLSSGGYCVNGGAMGPATNVVSDAVDKGNPASDWTKEPAPNGKRVNLGVYGNTTEASRTPVGQPSVTAFAVTFPNDETRPLITLDMGLASGTGYNALVTVVCKKNDVTVAERTYENVHNGDRITYSVPHYFETDDEITVSYRVTAEEATDVSDEKPVTVTGTKPAWVDAGGGEHVVHVREGADCLKNGETWGNAFPDVESALLAAATNALKTEVWIAKPSGMVNVSFTPDHALKVRGGFAGVESDAAERPEDAVSVFENENVKDCITVVNGEGTTVEFERIVFSRALNRGLNKSGAGDLVLNSCQFLANGTGQKVSGRGASVSGDAAKTEVVVSNCTFAGNMFNGVDQGAGNGGAILVQNCHRVFIDESLFASNGHRCAATYNNFSGTAKGAAILAQSAPIVARNSRFSGNCVSVRGNDDGGCVRLDGAGGGSAFTNCTFVGNCDWLSNQPQSGGAYNSGALVIALSAADAAVDVKNCTFAYNLSQGVGGAGGINVVQGAVSIRDSIVYGNVHGIAGATRGSDIAVRSGGSVTVDYALLTSTNAAYVSSDVADNLTIVEETVTTGDPLLVDTYESFTNHLVGTVGVNCYFPSPDFFTPLNVHLRGGSGYYDEQTGEKVKAYRRAKVGGSSPAIDTGDPRSDYGNEPEPNGNRVNLGAYGNTPWATMSNAGLILFVR